MNLQKLSEQFLTAAAVIEDSRVVTESGEECRFDINNCVIEYAGKICRLEEFKAEWTKICADGDFLDTLAREWDILISLTRGLSQSDINSIAKLVGTPKKSQKGAKEPLIDGYPTLSE